MPDYKTMYFQLFNKVSDAIEILQEGQQKGEGAYIESDGEIQLLILQPPGNDDEQNECDETQPPEL